MSNPRPDFPFRTARACGNATCVEVARQDGGYLIRDSKSPDGPVLSFTGAEWDVFAAAVRADEFDVD